MKGAFEYPALYKAANQLSQKAQENYLSLIKIEYFLLILASLLSLGFGQSRLYYSVCAFVFIASFVVMMIRTVLKPEQVWYRARALAESIKTSSWRYCMGAEPFGMDDDESTTKKEFCDHLKAILKANREIAERMPPDSCDGDQISASMLSLRELSNPEKRTVYFEERVKEQQRWYRIKASENRKKSTGWMIGAIITYLFAISLAIVRVVYPDIRFLPVEPLLLVAATIVGWTQIKKFNELSTSYALTAHEIGLIASVTDGGGRDFARFVLEAEQAFSREHTQWVARQTFQ